MSDFALHGEGRAWLVRNLDSLMLQYVLRNRTSVGENSEAGEVRVGGRGGEVASSVHRKNTAEKKSLRRWRG